MAPKRKEPGRGRATSGEPDVHHAARRIRTGASPGLFSQPVPPQFEGGSDELLNAHDPGPDVRLPQIFNFLRDADVERIMDWEHKLQDITRYLQNADRRRRTGDRRFTGALSKQLDLCFKLIAIHRRYEKWNRGVTPWSNDVLPKAHRVSRLEKYDRMFPAPPTQTGAENRPKTHVSLTPRPSWRTYSPFCPSRLEADTTPDWDAFFEAKGGTDLVDALEKLRDDEEMLWHNRAGHKNLSEMENATYERILAEHTLPRSVRDAATPSGTKKRPGSVRDFARLRGARRAILQKILNTQFTNQENRNLNTPWRRVALPESVPVREEDGFRPDAVVIHNRNATTEEGPKNALGSTEMDPSPWIYWYNKHAAQISMLSYWARELIKKENWLDKKQIALPYNYQGPYIFTPKSIFDEHWHVMGVKCIGLQHNLARAAGKHEPGGRYLLERVTQDVLAGINNAQLPPGILIRNEIDYNQKTKSFELVGDTEVEWLKYLLRPGSSSGFVGYGDRTPQDQRLILFDHRLQTLYNDAYTDLFWARDPLHRRDSAPTQYTSQKVPLTTLVDIINRGGRKLVKEEAGREVWRAADLDRNDAHPPNDLYQFSLAEARDASIQLARMGRLVYEGPRRQETEEEEDVSEGSHRHLSFYDSEDAGDWGSVGVRKMEVWPEECIVWRHASRADREKYNHDYKNLWVEYMLQQDSKTGERRFAPAEDWPREHYERQFLPEMAHAPGTYATDSEQARLQCPAFEDLVSFRRAFEKQLGLSERTVQYFRIIAYRMGLTIRNFRDVVARGPTDPPAPFNRTDLEYAVKMWEESVLDGRRGGVSPTYLPFIASRPHEVIARSQPNHPDVASEDPAKVYTAIRRGIIDDCVKNRTMLYPCRVAVYKDAAGRAGEAYERADLWGWADPTIRQHHAPYIRRAYFDVNRWPLNRQGEATRKRIRARLDEDPAVQPTLAWNRYGIRVGPRGGNTGAGCSDGAADGDVDMTDAPAAGGGGSGSGGFDFDLLGSLRPDQRPAARVLMQKFNEALVDMLKDASPALKDTWQLTITPPSSAESRGPKLVPIVAQQSRFFPGPSSFPMGDTLLKELKVSQDIMDMMDPPSNTLGSRLISKVTGWFAAEPERIPLFPAIDMNRAPRSNPLKRRLPPDFLTEVPPARKVVKLSDDGSNGTTPGSTTIAVNLGPGPGPQPAGGAAVALPAAAGVAGPSPAGVARPPPPPAAAAVAAGVVRTPPSPGARLQSRDGRRRKAAPGVLKKAGAPRTPKHAVTFNLPDTPPSPPPSATRASFRSGVAAVDPLPAHHHQPSPARQTATNASKPPWPQTMTPRPPSTETTTETTTSSWSQPSPARQTTTNASKPPWPQTMTPRPPTAETVSSDSPTPTPPPPPPPPRAPATPPPEVITLSSSSSSEMSESQSQPDWGRPLHPAEQQAIRLVQSAFPNGWERIPVSSSGLECGLRAVTVSATAQHQRPGTTTTTKMPTTAELRTVFFGTGMQTANAEAKLANTNNFTIDQLAGVLHRWRRGAVAAAAERGGSGSDGSVPPPRLHLGVIFDDRLPFVLWDYDEVDSGSGDPDRPRPHPDDKIVWVHTDDQERRYDDEIRQPGDETVILSHYSGLRRRDNPSSG